MEWGVRESTVSCGSPFEYSRLDHYVPRTDEVDLIHDVPEGVPSDKTLVDA